MPSSSFHLIVSDKESDSECSHHDDDGDADDVVKEMICPESRLWSRCVVHLDVDCFYCQCEEADGPPEYRERPLAIGQKHIIVTSNYVARRYGVKKLQSREDAKRVCPNLLILEGSDLERYRRHSRKIYTAFRGALKEMANNFGVDVQVRRGGMDEAFCDLTELVQASLNSKNTLSRMKFHPFVYGDDTTKKSSITEDQSGAEAIVGHHERISPSESAHVHYGTLQDRKDCITRLHRAAILCEGVRRSIKRQTNFTTTMGVSVSPLLAKLSSDLNKPNGLNILYPWRSGSIVVPMPLRKIPELGSRTLKALKECLKRHHLAEPKFWTCR